MAKYSHVQEKIHQEIDSVIGEFKFKRIYRWNVGNNSIQRHEDNERLVWQRGKLITNNNNQLTDLPGFLIVAIEMLSHVLWYTCTHDHLV